MAKNNWQTPVMIGAGVLVALAAIWWLRAPGTSAGYNPQCLGAGRPSLPSTIKRKPSRDYSGCGCGI